MKWKKLKAVTYIVVHGSATKDDQDIGVEEIRRSHRQKGWLDIGFHYVIRRDGTIEDGRPYDVPGAHARGYNDKSLGICLVGMNYTEVQLESLSQLLVDLTSTHYDAVVCQEDDLPNRNKPRLSFDLKAWWDSVE